MEWITTEDVSAETWRRILEYANTDLSIEAIGSRHGPATSNRLRRNYKKQAEQIRVAALQAHEYFQAAEASSLVTSPNHLYYGMVSLASAIMLLRGTGDKALDRLRQNPKNRHHGLDFYTSVSRSTCQTGLSILEQSYVKVLENGHFINWYSTLPEREQVFAVAKRFIGPRIEAHRYRAGGEDMLPPRELIDRKYAVINLLVRLPDLHPDLTRYGVSVAASRQNLEVTLDPANNKAKYQWRIHGAATPADLETLLEAFKSPACYHSSWTCTDYEGQHGCIVTYELPPHSHFEYPATRENFNNDQIAYAFPLDTLEIVDAYMVGYALSMLARYYPDYWIGCLDSHCKAASVIERVVFVLLRKFPLMTLKLLVFDDIIISTHRPPWFK